ncbi:hypothetical protein BU15DRAFT_81945 [Melanogaster broomeanus]|nr:hypothetical protein BU15DRAFT_81945 [Melanogaster broomeanus]
MSRFSLKFQQIVEDEQDANFISRLHGGKLNIIPWPVIESKDFYKLFPTLKRRLDQQVVTHKAAGEFLHLMKTLMAKLKANDWETMASHRAQLLLTMLPTALALGSQDDLESEPLKNLDTDVAWIYLIRTPDFSSPPLGICKKGLIPEAQWVEELSEFLEELVDMRIRHAGHASIMELHRTLESAVIDLKGSVQLCRMQCASCQLLCIQNRLHDGPHDCQTEHACTQVCEFCAELEEESDEGKVKKCSMTAGHSGKHVCAVSLHLCGAPCKLLGKSGCLEECSKVSGHEDEEHHCAASVHACGEVIWKFLKARVTPDSQTAPSSAICRLRPWQMVLSIHAKGDAEFQVISSMIATNATHNTVLFLASCADDCARVQIISTHSNPMPFIFVDTTPQSIQATFNGMHECFQYTKYSQVANRLKCVKTIPPGQLKHDGSHAHSLDDTVIHYCEERCASCEYFCTLPLGHSEQEHQTRHGSMSNVRWSIDGPDEEGLEVEGRRFSTNDEGAPMMCNLVCQAGNPEIQHSARKIQPDPDRPKDFLTHNLFWKRSGFKDPYSREEQVNFAKCDSMCSGSEHFATPGKPAQPSYCTLPLFHPPVYQGDTQDKQGYISHDGHKFTCRNPAVMQQAFHVIFLIDRSASMREQDRQPLDTSAVYMRIVEAGLDNRLGAVCAALYSFWTARIAASGQSRFTHRDSYSIVMHDQYTETVCENDLASSPDELLEMLLTQYPARGNSFNKAIKAAQEIMERWWSPDRLPVVVFLSDGIAAVTDRVVRSLFRSAKYMGGGLSLHAISFGPSAKSGCLRRMIEVALDEQGESAVPSDFHEALESVQLAQTFLGIANSLRKPRGALMQVISTTRGADFDLLINMQENKPFICQHAVPIDRYIHP